MCSRSLFTSELPAPLSLDKRSSTAQRHAPASADTSRTAARTAPGRSEGERELRNQGQLAQALS
ncbi:hypothetical protein ABZW47_31535 [Streptomyces sp. NPDC004549]|uniref:hypothetical protein n=1 Tax=Streptomyces sp. NPDC004549 TaxID=3154283 RepID=UPI0033B0809E